MFQCHKKLRDLLWDLCLEIAALYIVKHQSVGVLLGDSISELQQSEVTCDSEQCPSVVYSYAPRVVALTELTLCFQNVHELKSAAGLPIGAAFQISTAVYTY